MARRPVGFPGMVIQRQKRYPSVYFLASYVQQHSRTSDSFEIWACLLADHDQFAHLAGLGYLTQYANLRTTVQQNKFSTL